MAHINAHCGRFAFLSRGRALRSRVAERLRGPSEKPPLVWEIVRSATRRVAAERGVERLALDDVDLSLLQHERELDLLRGLADLPDVVADATETRSPHKVTTWSQELAGRFHGFYHDCRVLGEGVDADLTQARLWLVEATRVGLAIGLGLLGVSAPDSM